MHRSILVDDGVSAISEPSPAQLPIRTMREVCASNCPQTISIATALVRISEDLKASKSIVFKPFLNPRTNQSH